MVFLLDTLMQIVITLRHLVAEISRFTFDDYRVTHTGASDLKLFWGGIYFAIKSFVKEILRFFMFCNMGSVL